MAKQFGFGCMRLPLLDKDDQTSFDYETLNKLVDTFLEKDLLTLIQRIHIIDSGGKKLLREAIVKRHNRDEFTLTTKLPLRMLKSARRSG